MMEVEAVNKNKPKKGEALKLTKIITEIEKVER